MPLNDQQVKAAQPAEKLYRLGDGGSLYLVVRPSGAKAFEFRWKANNKVRPIVLGEYPALSLRDARLERDRVRLMVKAGRDPVAEKKLTEAAQREQLRQAKAARAQERAQATLAALTFEKVAREWIDRMRPNWTRQHADQALQSLEDHVFPMVGSKSIVEIGTADILRVLDQLLDAGKLETAQRVKQRIDSVFEAAALRHGIAAANPAALIKREFAARFKQARKVAPRQNFPCIPLAEAPALFRAIDAYTGPAKNLVLFIALTACRTGEARFATWDEIDMNAALWTIPATRMKARREHIVPLSTQAVALLTTMKAASTSRFLFRHPTKSDRVCSENAALFLLAAIDYKDRMTGHGFRSLFSTAANESGLWRSEVIEASLAHLERDDVRAAYNRSSFLQERRKLMQWWADELDRLRTVGISTAAAA